MNVHYTFSHLLRGCVNLEQSAPAFGMAKWQYVSMHGVFVPPTHGQFYSPLFSNQRRVARYIDAPAPHSPHNLTSRLCARVSERNTFG